MVSRLILGADDLEEQLVAELVGRTGDVRVIVENTDHVSDLPGDDVPTTVADPTDPDALREYAPVEQVLIAQREPALASAVLRAARAAFPAARIVVYAGMDVDESALAGLRASADDVLAARELLGKRIGDLIATRGSRQTRQLRRTLRAVDGELAVMMHDNPDPDAIASAIALVTIATAVGVDAQACYFGSISHQENRALVNLLELDLRQLDPATELTEFGGFALVDHSQPGINDQLPPDLAIDVVIDHHPPRTPVDATYVDLRSEVGATSTLMTDYLRQFGIEDLGGPVVTTALLYGIRVDTRDFSREVSRADFEAAAALLAHADIGILERIESPDVSPETFATLAQAIRNRVVRGTVVASCVGEMSDRDALAQAADRLLEMEGVSATLVYGYDDETVYASARARGTSLDLGETMRIAFGDLGNAGGHSDMAGAQVPLAAVLATTPTGDRWLASDGTVPTVTRGESDGPAGEPTAGARSGAADEPDGADQASSPGDTEDRLEDVVERVVSTAFFDAVRTHPRPGADGVEYATRGPIDPRSDAGERTRDSSE